MPTILKEGGPSTLMKGLKSEKVESKKQVKKDKSEKS